MATTPTPATETNPNDVGVFVSNTAIGYVLADPVDAARMTQALKNGSVAEMDKRFVNNLLILKLLAPTESAELLIYPVPMIRDFVATLRQELVLSYYLRQEDR